MEQTRAVQAKVIRRTQAVQAPSLDESKATVTQTKIREIAERSSSNEFQSLAEQIAKHRLHHRSWYYKDGMKFFPHHEPMRRVDKYFPLAVGGPLLVDEPRTEQEVTACYIKQKYLKNLGYRYVIIDPGTVLFDCLEQLGEV